MTATEKIVQQQVEAYNTRDIDKFAQLHAENVELFTFSENKPFAVGRADVKRIYGEVFENSPNLHTEIVNRMVMGNKVIDHEIVTGREGVQKLEIIAIYEINNGHISKAYFIRKD